MQLLHFGGRDCDFRVRNGCQDARKSIRDIAKELTEEFSGMWTSVRGCSVQGAGWHAGTIYILTKGWFENFPWATNWPLENCGNFDYRYLRYW